MYVYTQIWKGKLLRDIYQDVKMLIMVLYVTGLEMIFTLLFILFCLVPAPSLFKNNEPVLFL